MDATTMVSQRLKPLLTYTEAAKQKFGASAASVVIIQDNRILTEWYSGRHHFKSGALEVSANSMFNLYSLRKTYVGLATAIAIVEANIPIDSKVYDALSTKPDYELGDITIRDLATKTGAKYFGPDRIEREEVAADLIKQLTGLTIAELITKRMLEPMHATHTEWASIPKERLVCDFQAGGYASIRIESDQGHERNLYASTRDLALWGNLQLNRGLVNSNQLIPVEVFTLIDQLRAETQDKHRVFGWYYQDHCHYASGAAGCHCVIIPEFNAVGVRMLNKYTDNYAEDQQSFNELLYNCLTAMQ